MCHASSFEGSPIGCIKRGIERDPSWLHFGVFYVFRNNLDSFLYSNVI